MPGKTAGDRHVYVDGYSFYIPLSTMNEKHYELSLCDLKPCTTTPGGQVEIIRGTFGPRKHRFYIERVELDTLGSARFLGGRDGWLGHPAHKLREP